MVMRGGFKGFGNETSSPPSAPSYGIASSFPHYKQIIMPADQRAKLLAMHRASRANAGIYVAVVLAVYVILLTMLLCRYAKRQRPPEGPPSGSQCPGPSTLIVQPLSGTSNPAGCSSSSKVSTTGRKMCPFLYERQQGNRSHSKNPGTTFCCLNLTRSATRARRQYQHNDQDNEPQINDIPLRTISPKIEIQSPSLSFSLHLPKPTVV